MAALEDLKAATTVRGLSPSGLAKVVQIERFGDQGVKVTYEDGAGAVKNHPRIADSSTSPTPIGSGATPRVAVSRWVGTTA